MTTHDSIKIETLLEALPYIKKFRERTIVIAFNATLLGDISTLEQFAKDLVLLRFVGLKPIVLCPSGKEVLQWVARGGTPFFEISAGDQDSTAPSTASRVRDKIVSAIQVHGGRGVNISGRDAALFVASASADENNFGTMIEVTTLLIDTLCNQECIPVIEAVGSDAEGNRVPLQVDSAAAEVAVKIAAHKLAFLTDYEAVEASGKSVDFLELGETERLLRENEVEERHHSHLRGAVRAIKNGVKDVHVLSGLTPHSVLLELFTVAGVGTKISHRKRERIGNVR